MSINAKSPPIKPPFNLSKLDFIKRTSRKNVVALREVILIKARGAVSYTHLTLPTNREV